MKKLNESLNSHFDKIKKEWILIGSDIIDCPATKETIDKEYCKSHYKGKGCMHLKDGECTYEKIKNN